MWLIILIIAIKPDLYVNAIVEINFFHHLQIKRYFVSFWNGVDLRYRLLKGPKIRISIAGIIISRVSKLIYYEATRSIIVIVIETAGKVKKKSSKLWIVKWFGKLAQHYEFIVPPHALFVIFSIIRFNDYVTIIFIHFICFKC
jgi:hypothetical protein